jgi:glutamine synthetase
MTEMAARVDEPRRDGVRLLAGTIVDNAGVLRTKSVPGAQLQAAVTRGVGLSPVFAVMCVDGFITSAAGYGGPVGDMRAAPLAGPGRGRRPPLPDGHRMRVHGLPPCP